MLDLRSRYACDSFLCSFSVPSPNEILFSGKFPSHLLLAWCATVTLRVPMISLPPMLLHRSVSTFVAFLISFFVRRLCLYASCPPYHLSLFSTFLLFYAFSIILWPLWTVSLRFPSPWGAFLVSFSDLFLWLASHRRGLQFKSFLHAPCLLHFASRSIFSLCSFLSCLSSSSTSISLKLYFPLA